MLIECRVEVEIQSIIVSVPLKFKAGRPTSNLTNDRKLETEIRSKKTLPFVSSWRTAIVGCFDSEMERPESDTKLDQEKRKKKNKNKNNSRARFARAVFTLVHFADVVVLSTT